MLTKNELIYRANLAEDAYPTNGIDDEKWLFSLRGVSPGLQTFSCNGTIGFIQPEKNGHAIISFRGTELSDIQDLITDLKVKPVPNRKGPGLVHEGVQEALHGVWPQILTLLGEMEVRTVELVGHSLGSMLAVLSAQWLPAEGLVQVTRVISFGGPPVLSRDAANLLASQVEVVYVDNSVDIIPRLLTPRLMGLGRAGHLIYISEAGEIVNQPTLWWRFVEWAKVAIKERGNVIPGIKRHKIVAYLSALNASIGG